MKLNHRERKAAGHCIKRRKFFQQLYIEAESKGLEFTAMAAYNAYLKWNDRSNRYARIQWAAMRKAK